ncbi:MAG: hypothetical protein LC105_07475 [Chitinophagales bacterium]|nr:hypothetical protein [Chitinophagales bacterium]MCZ2393677.1 hypothetical protein [Chitinophagales bacterium]
MLSSSNVAMVGCHAVSIYIEYSLGMRFFQNGKLSDRRMTAVECHAVSIYIEYSLGMRPLQGDNFTIMSCCKHLLYNTVLV